LKIEELTLKEIFPEYYKHGYIREDEFDYAGVEGTAEFLTYHIIFFRKKNDNKTSAISISEIEDKYMIKIANKILSYTGVEIRFRDGHEKVKSIYGKPRSIDSTSYAYGCYNYLISPELFLSFAFSFGRLMDLEIIKDKDIIANVITVR